MLLTFDLHYPPDLHGVIDRLLHRGEDVRAYGGPGVASHANCPAGSLFLDRSPHAVVGANGYAVDLTQHCLHSVFVGHKLCQW